jgi:outer membrane protein assembly factor BamD (BamD/ComL family)
MLADLQFEKLDDLDEAFAEYRYLLDFYSLQCSFNEVADRMYEVAGRMREEGKTILFFRFRNTVDVRRAYECCVLRAPGAAWAAKAMLTVAELREEEGRYAEAIKVYENLRNLHPGGEEAKAALYREAKARMMVLREHEYNRMRCRDTIDFLRLAEAGCASEVRAEVSGWSEEARGMLEDEAYLAAKFYDSKTRTVRSAISAYERFLAEFPLSVRAAEVKARLEQLKANGGEK